MTDLVRAVEEAEVVVVTGAGGVGKTTVAAALGLAAADAGRTVLVVTIDPARRLAGALGLAALGREPETVTETTSGGRLDAMMLDMRSTFDGLVDRFATSPAQAREVKGNRIYRTLSSNLAGTQEYMAMEKLHELHDLGQWELVVVDTPPSRSALDFLDAPTRMTAFLDGTLLRLLLRPAAVAGRGYLRLVGLGASAFMRVAGKVTGIEVLDDLATFFANFEGMYAGFRERATQVQELLAAPASRFVVVATPDPAPLREARWFVRRLRHDDLHLAGLVVNRVHTVDGNHDPCVLRTAADRVRTPDGDEDARPGRALAAGIRVLAAQVELATRDHDAIAAGVGPRTPVTVVGDHGEVHTLAGLRAIGRQLRDHDLPTT